jgi:oligosaccharide repeat unit polymerase
MIYIPFTYFFILLIFNYYRTRSFGLGNFLLLLYCLSAFLSIFLYSVEFLQYKNIEIKLTSCILYCGILTIFFLPFLSDSQSKNYRMLLPDVKTFTLVSLLLIAINTLAIMLLLKVIFFILSHDPGSLRDGGIRLIYPVNATENIGLWLLGHFSDFYLLLLVFFFYSKTYLKNRPLFNGLLLISSMSTIVNGLMSGGRTQTIYWVLVFISCFIYFKKDMPQKVRKTMVRVSFVLLSVLSIYLISVTVFRFSNVFSGATEYDEAFSLLDYSGQIFLNFNNFIANFQHKHYTLARIFPIIYDWFNDPNFDLVVYKRSIPMDIGVFSTFLGDFYIDMGIAGIIAYTLFFTAAAFFVRRNYIQGARKFQQILLYFLLFQIPLNGLFYYSLYTKTATISVIGTVIIAILFKFSERETIEMADTNAG